MVHEDVLDSPGLLGPVAHCLLQKSPSLLNGMFKKKVRSMTVDRFHVQ